MQLYDWMRAGEPPDEQPAETPRSGWPREISETVGGWLAGAVREHGPGPVLAALAVLVAVLGVLWLVASSWLEKRRDQDRPLLGRRRVGPDQIVRTILEERRLRVPFLTYWPFFGRLYVGAHALVLAATGTGKGVAVMLPALAYHAIHWSKGRALRHLLILDPKAELLRYLLPLLDRFGWRVFVYSFVPQHPVSSASNVVSSEARARTVANALWEPVEGEAAFWHAGARNLFLAAVRFTRYAGLWQAYELLRDLEALEEAAREDEGLKRAFLNLPEKTRMHHWGAVTGALEGLENPATRRVFDPGEGAEQPDFAGSGIPCAGFVAVDFESAPNLGPLLTLLLAVLHEEATGAGKPTARRRGPGTYAYLDEATSMLRMPKIMGWLAVGRGSRTYTAVCGQDVSQIIDALGRYKAMSTMNNAHVTMIGQSEDPETLKYAEGLSGHSRIVVDKPRPAPKAISEKDDRVGRSADNPRRPNMLGDHFREMGWGEFMAKAQPDQDPAKKGKTGPVREVVRMPHPDRYWDKLLQRVGAGPWDYDPYGVPDAQFGDLAERLVSDPKNEELWSDPWVPERIKEVARNFRAKRKKSRKAKARAVLHAGRGAGEPRHPRRSRTVDARAEAPETPEGNVPVFPSHGRAANGEASLPRFEPTPGHEARDPKEGERYGGWEAESRRNWGGEPEPDDHQAKVGPSGKIECPYCGSLNEPTARLCEVETCGTQIRS